MSECERYRRGPMSNGVDDVLVKRNRSKANRENIGDVGWNDKIKEKDNEMGVRITQLQDYDFVLTHIPGKQNSKADMKKDKRTMTTLFSYPSGSLSLP
jgi:predicted TIM-barrel fold metal-dependent hydrolase